MRFKNDDNTEKRCQYCGQTVPLRRDGTMVTHYKPISSSKYAKKQMLCKGSEEGKL